MLPVVPERLEEVEIEKPAVDHHPEIAFAEDDVGCDEPQIDRQREQAEGVDKIGLFRVLPPVLHRTWMGKALERVADDSATDKAA